MKTMRFFWLTATVLLFMAESSFSQSWQWVASSGGIGRDEAELPAVDEWGNVTVCGKFSDTAWFGTSYLVSSGNMDIFIARYNASGNFIWARKAGTSLNAEGLSIAAGPGGDIAVTGHYKGTLTVGAATLTGNTAAENLFIALYDSSGTLKWAKTATGGPIHGKGVEFDPIGNVLVTGHYRDSAVFSPTVVLPNVGGQQNAFLAKYSASGNLEWATYGGGIYNAWASSVGVDNEGNSYITGAFKDTCWFGAQQIITNGLNDVFLAKCSPNGQWVWARNGGGSSDDYGNGIEVDVFGHIAVTGSFFDTVTFAPSAPFGSYGGKDGFIAYYAPNGNCLWAHPFGGASEDKGIGVSTDVAGNVYVTGFVKNSGTFGTIVKTCVGGDDISLAKYDRNGNVLWAALAGGSGADYGKGIKVDKQGVAVVAGYYEGTASFSGTQVTAKGGRESYVSRYYDGSPMLSTQPQSQAICVGDSLLLSVVAVSDSAKTYAWFHEGAAIATATGQTLKLLVSNSTFGGKYYCKVSNTFGVTISDTAVITVNPQPVSALPDTSINYILGSDTLILDAGAGFVSYLWETGDTSRILKISGHDLYPYLVAKSGIVQGFLWLQIVDSNGCSAVDSVDITVIYGIQEVEEVYFNVFPVPASDYIHIHSNMSIHRIDVLNVLGEVVLSKEGDDSQGTIRLPLNLPPGVYFVRLQSANRFFTRKVVVK